MIWIFLILLLPNSILSESTLVNLKDLEECGDKKLYYSSKLYTVPFDDSETKITDILYYFSSKNYEKLKYPNGPKIESQYETPASASDQYELCYNSDGFDPTKSTGKVYITDEDLSVYQWRDGDYSIDSTTKHTVIFARNGSVTLRNFKTTDFIVYSGLPEDEDSTGIFKYNADLPVDELYIQDDYFYVESPGSSFKVDVASDTENPLKKVFKTNGFILSPGFPSAPTEEFQNFKVSLEKSNQDRKITLQITSSEIVKEEELKNKLASNAVQSTEVVTVSYGDIKISFSSGSSGTQVLPFPANTDGFTITATSAYAVQFDIPEVVTTSTTEKSPEVTTQKPHDSTSKSPEDCSCSSTTSFTTETPSTTTDSAMGTSAFFSVLILVFVYLL